MIRSAHSIGILLFTLAGYSPWKLPPDMVSALFAKIIYTRRSMGK